MHTNAAYIFLQWQILFPVETAIPVYAQLWCSSTEGCLPPKAVFHRRSSSTEGRLLPKVVFSWEQIKRTNRGGGMKETHAGRIAKCKNRGGLNKTLRTDRQKYTYRGGTQLKI